MSASLPANEAQRLAALRAYNILDSAPEQLYDDVVKLVTYVCQVPMATISLVDEHRQWFKSRIGVEDQETSREISFCAHTILGNKPLMVRDATEDPRFAASPLVTGPTHVRFYGGFPLIAPDGHALGSLCAMDRTPRELTQEQQTAMTALSNQVMALLELRRVSSQMAAALERIKALESLLTICAWCKRIREFDGSWLNPDVYIKRKAEAPISHGICPDCFAQQRSKATGR
jgi:GAF domain-containing protein